MKNIKQFLIFTAKHPQMTRQILALKRCGLFSNEYYLINYPDVAESGYDPLIHYIERGYLEGRNPNLLFDSEYYLTENPDVRKAGINPLLHYAKYGFKEGRDPSWKFNTKYYLETYPDVFISGLNPLYHYLHYGISEGRRTAPSSQSNNHLTRSKQVNRFTFQAPQVDNPSKAFEKLDLESAKAFAASSSKSFSIIIPTWNRKATIGKSIDSVLAQSFQNFQVIVIDDGSTDNTKEYLQEHYSKYLSDKKIIYFWQDHSGVSAARNLGLSVASGDWIAYLDSDNTWHKDYLLVTAATFIQNSDCYTHYTSLNVTDDISKRTFVRNRSFTWSELVKSNFIDLNVFSHHRRLYLELGGFDKSLTRLVDWDIILRYTKLYPPRFTNSVLADYQISKKLNNITITEALETNRQAVWTKNQWDIIRSDGKNNLRLAYVLNDFPALSQTFVNDEIAYLIDMGYDVNVYYTIQPDRVANLLFNVEAYFVSSSEELEVLLIEHGRNWCHSHFIYPVVTNLVWPIAERLKIPFSFMPHAVDLFHVLNKQRNKLAEVANSQFCKRVFVYGFYHRQYLINNGVSENKIVMMPQAVDCNLDEFRQSPLSLPAPNNHKKQTYKIVSIARFIEKKGIKYLLEAAHKLKSEDIEVHVHGYGPLEREFKEYIVDNNLSNVFIHGSIEGKQAIASILLEADLFVLPCVEASDGNVDGMPTVFFQAMSLGIPVLGTTVSAIPDFIEHEISGFLVPPENSEALAHELSKIMKTSQGQLQRITDNAKRVIDSRVGLSITANTLLDIIARSPIDIFMVTYCRNGIGSLKATQRVVKSLFEHTTTPFTLTILDNASEPKFIAGLRSMSAQHKNIRLLELDKNHYCGPASNIACKLAESEYVIYVCSNEGLVIKSGWERTFINFMRNHERVAMAGHLISSPKWLSASQYMEQPWFQHFRNPEFATQNLTKQLQHVQGGMWVLRRSVFEELGGFNPKLPQGHMDVEYSYYLESEGWKLGNIPELVAVSNKTRPGIEAFVDESTVAAHPVFDQDLPLLEWCAKRKGQRCNISGWMGQVQPKSRRDSFICPVSGSTAFTRSIYRYLAESSYIYRRLALVALAPDSSLKAALAPMFDVKQYTLRQECSVDALLQSIQAPVDVLILSDVPSNLISENYVDERIRKSVKPQGCVIFSLEPSVEFDVLPQALETTAMSVGFSHTCLTYSSNVLGHGLLPIYVWQKAVDSPNAFTPVDEPTCNICGSHKFGLGPGGRKSGTGFPPRCESCQSLERHRVFRSLLEQLNDSGILDARKTLQFSSDKSAKAEWFGSYEVSIYGGDNSLDLTQIARKDHMYDLVICNHVLEHVSDDIAALRELARIINEDGFIFLSFPDPLNLEETRDWGYPDYSQHGHYRIYGKDVLQKFKSAIPSLHVLACIEPDPVTGVKDMAFFIYKEAHIGKKLSQAVSSCRKFM
ncbi:glycosyl transferase family 2 [Leptolyngbya sp. Heron Island J]|uniref:glycosyltransferase n=1 Tax=Leptolyngbya sp. Heron Island J TaxID=1385935 RepID=UPI0003B9E11F|nr:glycosyltransferase [Leptolyngbya sp. Heron Island J]ESA33021.1 glycosyl transferase family 2 [Leptolyngbya sp. Heron Island J]